MTKTKKFVAVLTILGATLGAGAPAAMAATGGERTVDVVNARGHLGGGRIADDTATRGHLGGGRIADDTATRGHLGGGRGHLGGG